MIIIDNKIILRKPEITDIEEILTIKNDKEAGLLLGSFKEGYTKEEILKWIEYHNNHPREILFVIYDLELKSIVGHIGLYEIDHRVHKAEFGILIGNRSCRGKGYGSLCLDYMLKIGFGELNLNRIELSLLSENIPALKLYKKFGFEIEGIQKQAQFKNGKYYNVILMAILKENYNA